MASTTGEAQSPPSENDAGERPVRKQLKETSIDSATTSSESRRKRSFDEARADDAPGDTANADTEAGESRRKRSRESSPQEAGNTATKTDTKATDTTTDTSAMPKKKRSLEQLDEVASKKSDAVTEAAEHPAETQPSEESLGEPEKKRPRDNSEERSTKAEKGFAASAFANTSATSPFASLAASKSSDEPPTTDSPASTSAFASSSLAAFAGSDKSPFGTLGASTPSVFKSSDNIMSGFASASGGSGFGKLGSGFAGVGGGFTAAGKSGGLSSFASPNAPATFGETKAKPLGAEEPQDEEDDNDEDEDEEGTNTFEAEKTDQRFFEQTIETGEEEEYTVFSCKGKLFHYSGEWKERGIGTFKLNARESSTHPGKLSARMIMRADGALRVMLNSPLFKGMNFGGPKNECPTSKQILLSSIEDGRTVPLLLRVGNEDLAKDLYSHIQKTLDAMSDKDDGTKEQGAEPTKGQETEPSKDQSDEKKDE